MWVKRISTSQLLCLYFYQFILMMSSGKQHFEWYSGYRIGKIIIIFLSLVRKTLVGVSGLDHGVYNTGWFMKSSHKGWESTGWCQTGLLMPIEDLRRPSPQWNFTSVIHATGNVFKHPICSVITFWIRSSGNK